MIFIKVFYQQGEEEAEIVRIRLESVGVDLHQSDARFYKNLYNTFTSVRNNTAAQRKSTVFDHEQDKEIEKLFQLLDNMLKKCGATELQKLYKQNHGTDCNRRRLVNKITWNIRSCCFPKEPPRDDLSKSCFKNMQQIYRRTPMPKCAFNHTSAWVVSCKFAAYF